MDWRRVVRKDPARVDLCWVTHSFLNGDVWLIVSPNFGKNKYCVSLHFISYICVCLDLAWVVLACVQQYSITQLLQDLVSKGSKLLEKKESIFQFSQFTATTTQNLLRSISKMASEASGPVARLGYSRQGS